MILLRLFRRSAIVLAAIVACSCGDKAPPTPADPGEMQSVGDEAAGFRLAVPVGWVRAEYPPTDPMRHVFAGTWTPPNVALPAEAILVHMMAPGCAAADFGGQYKGAEIASRPKPEGFSMTSSGAGKVGDHAAFRMEVRYKADIGQLFEASAYVETSEGAGYLVTSRGPDSAEALTRARLESALGGFRAIPRTIRLGPPGLHAGGFTFAFPTDFVEYFGPAPRGFSAYAVGAIDGKRSETISMLIVPDARYGPDFWKSVIGQLSKDMKPGEPRKIRMGDAQGQAVLYQPEQKTLRWESAMAMSRIGSMQVTLVVQAPMNPPGRATALLDAVVGSLSWKEEPEAELEERTFGEGGCWRSMMPRGWESGDDGSVLTASRQEVVPPEIPGGEVRHRLAQLVQISFLEDVLGDETPASCAKWFESVDRKKANPLGTEEFTLPDGRGAARLTTIMEGGVGVIMLVRASSGAIAQVRVLGLPGLAASSARLAERIVSTVGYVPLADQTAPDPAVAKASKEILGSIVERARARSPQDSWYLLEAEGKVFGGTRVSAKPDGTWMEKQVQPGPSTFTSLLECAPDRLTETVVRTGKVEANFVTKIDSSGADWILVSRAPAKGEERHDKLPKTDLLLPPDVSASDGFWVGLAGAPEGTYTFQIVAAGQLFTRYREVRVKGEEEVDGPSGKVKARRIEMGKKSVVWVADGRVIRADNGDSTRRLTTEDEGRKLVKD